MLGQLRPILVSVLNMRGSLFLGCHLDEVLLLAMPKKDG